MGARANKIPNSNFAALKILIKFLILLFYKTKLCCLVCCVVLCLCVFVLCVYLSVNRAGTYVRMRMVSPLHSLPAHGAADQPDTRPHRPHRGPEQENLSLITEPG